VIWLDLLVDLPSATLQVRITQGGIRRALARDDPADRPGGPGERRVRGCEAWRTSRWVSRRSSTDSPFRIALEDPLVDARRAFELSMRVAAQQLGFPWDGVRRPAGPENQVLEACPLTSGRSRSGGRTAVGADRQGQAAHPPSVLFSDLLDGRGSPFRQGPAKHRGAARRRPGCPDASERARRRWEQAMECRPGSEPGRAPGWRTRRK